MDINKVPPRPDKMLRNLL